MRRHSLRETPNTGAHWWRLLHTQLQVPHLFNQVKSQLVSIAFISRISTSTYCWPHLIHCCWLHLSQTWPTRGPTCDRKGESSDTTI